MSKATSKTLTNLREVCRVLRSGPRESRVQYWHWTSCSLEFSHAIGRCEICRAYRRSVWRRAAVIAHTLKQRGVAVFVPAPARSGAGCNPAPQNIDKKWKER